MSQPVSDKFMELYNEFSQPYIESLENVFYTNCIILDLVAKKKAKLLEKRLLTKDPQTGIFDTYSGLEKQVFIADDRMATVSEVVNGFAIEDGDEMNPMNKDVGIWGSFYPSNIGVAMSMTLTEKQALEDMVASRKNLDLKEHIEGKNKMLVEDVKFSFAYKFYRGLGGDTPKAAYNTNFSDLYTTSGWNWGTTSAKPNKREPEGLFSFAMNPLVTKYGCIDNSTNKFYKPRVYDFSVAAGTSNLTNVQGLNGTGTSLAAIPFGYAVGNIDSESELMSATNSSTANVPIIIDIVDRVISDMSQNRKKPTCIICRREWFSLIVRAKKSKAYSSTGYTEEKLTELVDMGYPEHTVISNVAIIPDDTSYETKDGTKVFACPQNVFLLVELNNIKILAHKTNNWANSGWEKIQGKFNIWINSMTATIHSYITNRWNFGVIKMYALYND